LSGATSWPQEREHRGKRGENSETVRKSSRENSGQTQKRKKKEECNAFGQRISDLCRQATKAREGAKGLIKEGRGRTGSPPQPVARVAWAWRVRYAWRENPFGRVLVSRLYGKGGGRRGGGDHFSGAQFVGGWTSEDLEKGFVFSHSS